jgi:hypothetical protein
VVAVSGYAVLPTAGRDERPDAPVIRTVRGGPCGR